MVVRVGEGVNSKQAEPQKVSTFISSAHVFRLIAMVVAIGRYPLSHLL